MQQVGVKGVLRGLFLPCTWNDSCLQATQDINHINHINHVNNVNQVNHVNNVNQVNHVNNVNQVNHVNHVNNVNQVMNPFQGYYHLLAKGLTPGGMFDLIRVSFGNERYFMERRMLCRG